MLLITCLVINIAFFSEVREPFLGKDDPLASVKSAFAELDIQSKFAEFYPKVQSKVDNVSIVTPPEEPEERTPVQKKDESAPQAENPPSRKQRQPLPPKQPEESVEPQKDVPKVEPKEAATKEPVGRESVSPVLTVTPVRGEVNLQTAATIPIPKAAPSVANPVVANQCTPILTEPRPTEPVKPIKPSSNPVWETVDSVLNRPIRYDR